MVVTTVLLVPYHTLATTRITATIMASQKTETGMMAASALALKDGVASNVRCLRLAMPAMIAAGMALPRIWTRPMGVNVIAFKHLMVSSTAVTIAALHPHARRRMEWRAMFGASALRCQR